MSLNSNEQSKMLALKQLNTINNVEGFDPEAFAVEFTDLSTGEKMSGCRWSFKWPGSGWYIRRGKLLFRYPAEKIVLLRLLVSMPTIRIRWSAIWRKPQHQEVYRQQSRQSLPGNGRRQRLLGSHLVMLGSVTFAIGRQKK